MASDGKWYPPQGQGGYPTGPVYVQKPPRRRHGCLLSIVGVVVGLIILLVVIGAIVGSKVKNPPAPERHATRLQRT